MEQIPKYLCGAVLIALLCFSPLQRQAAAGEGPDEVEIDVLAQLYEPVQFDHLMHEDIAEGNCAVCHHHTLGGPVENENCARCHANSGEADEVSCQGCHSSKRFEAEYLNQIDADNMLHHRAKVGLKAAYHLNCMGCHEEMGGPNGCQDCHARTDAGNKFFHAGSYAPPESDTPPAGSQIHGGEEHGGGH